MSNSKQNFGDYQEGGLFGKKKPPPAPAPRDPFANAQLLTPPSVLAQQRAAEEAQQRAAAEAKKQAEEQKKKYGPLSGTSTGRYVVDTTAKAAAAAERVAKKAVAVGTAAMTSKPKLRVMMPLDANLSNDNNIPITHTDFTITYNNLMELYKKYDTPLSPDEPLSGVEKGEKVSNELKILRSLAGESFTKTEECITNIFNALVQSNKIILSDNFDINDINNINILKDIKKSMYLLSERLPNTFEITNLISDYVKNNYATINSADTLSSTNKEILKFYTRMLIIIFYPKIILNMISDKMIDYIVAIKEKRDDLLEDGGDDNINSIIERLLGKSSYGFNYDTIGAMSFRTGSDSYRSDSARSDSARSDGSAGSDGSTGSDGSDGSVRPLRTAGVGGALSPGLSAKIRRAFPTADPGVAAHVAAAAVAAAAADPADGAAGAGADGAVAAADPADGADGADGAAGAGADGADGADSVRADSDRADSADGADSVATPSPAAALPSAPASSTDPLISFYNSNNPYIQQSGFIFYNALTNFAVSISIYNNKEYIVNKLKEIIRDKFGIIDEDKKGTEYVQLKTTMENEYNTARAALNAIPDGNKYLQLEDNIEILQKQYNDETIKLEADDTLGTSDTFMAAYNTIQDSLEKAKNELGFNRFKIERLTVPKLADSVVDYLNAKLKLKIASEEPDTQKEMSKAFIKLLALNENLYFGKMLDDIYYVLITNDNVNRNYPLALAKYITNGIGKSIMFQFNVPKDVAEAKPKSIISGFNNLFSRKAGGGKRGTRRYKKRAGTRRQKKRRGTHRKRKNTTK
jgi:hypothetical protein